MQTQLKNQQTDKYKNSVSEKPAVCILIAGEVSKEIIQPIIWGLEEQGIPHRVSYVSEEPANSLAKTAALSSKLNVGIGVTPKQGNAVLHHRDLPVEKPLFVLPLSTAQKTDLMRIGANAARLVKGNRLCLKISTL